MVPQTPFVSSEVLFSANRSMPVRVAIPPMRNSSKPARGMPDYAIPPFQRPSAG